MSQKLTTQHLTSPSTCENTYAVFLIKKKKEEMFECLIVFDIIADWLEMPGSLILLLVVAPNFFAETLKESWVGILICLLIGCYLLQEHIRSSGGFRNSFTQSHGISNTLGIVLLLVYPVWALVLHFI